jgi:replicative DNA helicase
VDEEELDRQPPQDLAAEKAFLGAVLLSEQALAQMVDAVRVEEFYRPAHATIWATCLEMYAGGDPADVITVADRLSSAGELLRVGGLPYLHTLISEVPTAANAGYYAGIVRRKAIQRQGVQLGVGIVETSYSWPEDEEGLAARIEAECAKLAVRESRQLALVSLDDAVDQAFDRLSGPVPPAISTGVIDLDTVLTGGLRPGDLYVVAARPGQGKSLVGSNIALNVAKSGIGVLVCSLEMSSEEITNRTLANAAGVRLYSIMRHELDDLEWRRLERARESFRGSPLSIQDTPDATAAGIRRQCERLARRPAGLGLLVVDYAQLVTPSDPRLPRQEQVADISRSMKRLAGHLHIPVMLISQTNRRDAERPQPSMGDLRESGSLEADASAVIILRRPDQDTRAGELDLHVVKNRHGPEAVITVAYSPHYSRVRCMATDYQREEAA